DNQGLELRVNNQRALRLDNASLSTTWNGQPATIRGTTLLGGFGSNRAVGPGTTICGGGLRITYPNGYTEDWPNVVVDVGGTVGGGASNQAGTDDGVLDDASFATVAGGILNRATSQAATVGGGLGNEATGAFATVGGGNINKASGDYS